MVTCNWGRWDKTMAGKRIQLLDKMIEAVGLENAKCFTMNIATYIQNDDLFYQEGYPLRPHNYKGIRTEIDNTVPDKCIYLIPEGK
jgi:hypothetical protein